MDDSLLYGVRWIVICGGIGGCLVVGILDVVGGVGVFGVGGFRVGVFGMGLDGWVFWGEVDSCGIFCCDGNWGGGCVFCGDGDWGGVVVVFIVFVFIVLVCIFFGVWFWDFILGFVGFFISNVVFFFFLDYGELVYISVRGFKVLVYLMEKEDKS